MRSDGYKNTDLKKSYKAAGANVKESRLNKGGDMKYRGKRKGKK